MSLAVVLLALQSPRAHGPEPGPRAAIAGMAGFQTVSWIDYGTVRNRFTAVYVFPDRTRWHFDNPDDKGAPHQFFYRGGEQVFTLESRPSRRLVDDERDAVLRQMELRRAAMLWPDGFDWKAGEGGTRTAEIHVDSCCREVPVGRLVAFLVNERPNRIEVQDGLGATVETIGIREWQDHLGRAWPRVLAVETAGGGFTETIESIETRVHYLELSFVPPDQRPVPKALDGGLRVTALDLVAISYSPRELEAGVTWELALSKTRAWIDGTREDSGLDVDSVPTIEIDAEARPKRSLVRLRVSRTKPPEGFTTVEDRSGLLLGLPSLEAVNKSLLDRLRAAVPVGSKAGTPYVRIHQRQNLPIELVLPLEALD